MVHGVQDSSAESASTQLIAAELGLVRSQLADAGEENARLENKLALCQHRLQEMRLGHSNDLGAQVLLPAPYGSTNVFLIGDIC